MKLHIKISISEGEDDQMTTQNANFTVTVKPAAAALTITPNGGNLNSETVGVADPGDKVCNISGGTPPYQFSVSQGSLPPGMGLTAEQNADGVSTDIFIEGTPTQSGAFSFQLSVSDAAGATASTQSRVPVSGGPSLVSGGGGSPAPGGAPAGNS